MLRRSRLPPRRRSATRKPPDGCENPNPLHDAFTVQTPEKLRVHANAFLKDCGEITHPSDRTPRLDSVPNGEQALAPPRVYTGLGYPRLSLAPVRKDRANHAGQHQLYLIVFAHSIQLWEPPRHQLLNEHKVPAASRGDACKKPPLCHRVQTDDKHQGSLR